MNIDPNRHVDADLNRHVDADLNRHVDADLNHHVDADLNHHVDVDLNHHADQDQSLDAKTREQQNLDVHLSPLIKDHVDVISRTSWYMKCDEMGRIL